MPRMSTVRGLPVFDSKNRYRGAVSAVLFHPSEPRVVGIEVERQMLGDLITLRPRYVPLDGFSLVKEQGILVDGEQLPEQRQTEKELGFSWDDTVIWRGMPVRARSGEDVGSVKDVLYSTSTGAVLKLTVSTGVLGDVAAGRLEVDADVVKGFDGEAVILLPEYKDAEKSGGAAKAAATGYTAVKNRTGQVADGLGQVGTAVAGAVGRSFKSGIGRKAVNKAKSLMGDDK